MTCSLNVSIGTCLIWNIRNSLNDLFERRGKDWDDTQSVGWMRNAIARNNPINPGRINATQCLWGKDGVYNDSIHSRDALTLERLSCDGQCLTAASDIINDDSRSQTGRRGKVMRTLRSPNRSFVPMTHCVCALRAIARTHGSDSASGPTNRLCGTVR